MANLNKVLLIGRLTRDPEVRTFSNGGKVAKFGFAVNNRKFNNQTNQWEDEPVFLDVDVFNRGEKGKDADRVEQTLRKGQQIFIEGHLKLDQWTAQDGQKRTRLYIVCDNFQYLERREDGGGGQGMPPAQRSAPAARRPMAPQSPPSGGYEGEPEPPMDAPSEGHGEDIPF